VLSGFCEAVTELQTFGVIFNKRGLGWQGAQAERAMMGKKSP